jgi:hypothetical protein
VDDIERASTAAIVPLPLAIGAWYAAELSLPTDDTLRIVFRERGSGDEIHILVMPRDAPAPVFRRLNNCALRYNARIAKLTEQRRAEVSSLLLAIGASLDERLADGRSIAEVLGAERSSRRVVFGREMLRAFLSPEIAEGVPVAGGFVLHDVYPASQRRLGTDDELELVIEMRRDLRRALFSVGRASDRSALVRTKNFSVVEIVGARADADGIEALRALLSFVFQLRDHDGLDVSFPAVIADLGLRALPQKPEEARADGSLNLALDADCEQQCAFCSVKDASPAYDGGDTVLARALADLAANAARGIRHLRLNGYDPLAYSGVLDVLAEARHLQFEKVDVFSPCTRLADADFCRDVIELLPREHRFHVPLYAPSADAHDRFVGRAGAFELVLRAIENITARSGAGAIHILTVATTHNLGELPALQAWARARRLSFSAHTPYPMNEGRDDRFFTAAAKQTAIAEVAVDLHLAHGDGRRDPPVHGVAPCVMFRAFRARGVAPWQWLMAGEVARIPGAEYEREDIVHGSGDRSTDAFRVSTIACPHKSGCALVAACGGSILRAYVERYGEGEFQPVDLRTLVETTAPRS